MIAHPRRSARKVAAASLPTHDHEEDYQSLLAGVRETFAEQISGGSRLFATTAGGLFDLYLDALPGERQIHNCIACRRFMKEFGGLATISEDGQLSPAMWNRCPDFYRPAVLAMAKAVRRARVTAPFLRGEAIWGFPRTGSWVHLAVEDAPVFRDRVRTPKQAMAAKREDFKTVAAALADFTPAMLSEALRLLETDSLHRSERFIAPVKWLIDLQTRRAAAKGLSRDNILWRAIAAAPDGFCHPRASVIGSLLEDIAAGKTFEQVRASFNLKMGGLVYQRPQTAPPAGNIAAAEKLVEQMGIAPSLHRRFARVDELETIWASSVPVERKSQGGVFGHLTAKGDLPVPALTIPDITMTWAKFQSVLDGAERIELKTPSGNANFSAFVTATDFDAPLIIRWDREDARNPVSQYVYLNGSPAQSWNLAPGSWCAVNAIARRANMWGDKPARHLGDGVTLVLEGAVDTRENQGNALFPEILRDDLHQVRATIEAYSRRAEIGGRQEASACGLAFGTKEIGAILRALSGDRWTTYFIDRWD